MNADGVRARFSSKKWVILLGGFLVILATWTCFKFWPPARHSPELRAQLHALREAGEPVTYEDLETLRIPVPRDQDSIIALAPMMDDLEQLLARASKDDPAMAGIPFFGGGKLPEWPAGLDQQTLEKVKAFLVEHQKLLEGLESVRDKPTGRYLLAHDPEDPMSVMLPFLSPVRTALKLTMLDALAKAYHGQLSAALAQCELMVNLYAGLSDAPVLVCALVYCSGNALTVDALERVLTTSACEASFLQRLETQLRRHDQSETMLWAMRGERLSHISIYDSLRKAGRSAKPPPGVQGLVAELGREALISALLDDNEIKTIELTSKKVEAAKGDYHAALQQVDDWDLEIEELPQGSITKMLTRSIPKGFILYGRALAQVRCARVGLAAERYRLQHDHWPEQLELLVPDYMENIPDDPFAGKPVRYRKDDNMIIVYSIEKYEKDKHGKAPKDHGPDYPDVCFRLLNPELRRIEPAPLD